MSFDPNKTSMDITSNKGEKCNQVVPTDIRKWKEKGKKHIYLIREYKFGSSTIYDIKLKNNSNSSYLLNQN